MKFAFVFPGQGSQKIGMLSNIAKYYPIVKETFAEASSVLKYDLWKLIQEGSIEELNKTWKTQPALLVSSIALWRIWKLEKGNNPILMAGHSLGEYSALVCAGVINFLDAVNLVEIRGRLMQEVISENNIGAMVAVIGLDENLVTKICEESSKDQLVSLVNFNSPKQLVIGGNKEAVDRAVISCKKAGAKHVLPLPIIVPSHCVLMKPAAQKLALELEKIIFNTPVIQVVNNVDVKCEIKPKLIRNALIRQLYNPVQWVKIVKFMYNQGVNHLYEIGPGKVLTNLTKHIVDTLTASAFNEPDVVLSVLSK